MKYILILFIVLFSFNAYAGDFVIYDSEGKILSKHRSVSDHLFDEGIIVCPNYLKISRDKYASITRWHKVLNSEVALMTQAEKDIILQAEAEAQIQAEILKIDNLNITVKDAFVAFVKVYNSKVPVKYQITKQEIIDQVKQDKGL